MDYDRVLVLFAHPALEKSRVNVQLIRGIEELESVTFRDLYEEYPQLDIDVEREQQLLEEHEIVVFQHPFYWYSTPAMLKEWQDLVLEHGWAYGSGGEALAGKVFLNVITAGGSEEAYCTQGSNRFSVRDLLAPLEQTAHLCGMRYLAPFVIHGTHALSLEEIDEWRDRYHRLLRALVDDRLDLDRASASAALHRDVDALITSPAGQE